MSAIRRSTAAAAIVAVVGLTAAACGSGSSGSTAPQGATTPAGASGGAGQGTAATNGASPSAPGVALTVRNTSDGSALALVGGNMVYLWEADKGHASTCYGPCALAWPPVIASGKVKVEGGVRSALLGTTKRNDGKQQVTYGGHPLYLYAGDDSPTAVNGQDNKGFGAAWYLVKASGDSVDEGDDD